MSLRFQVVPKTKRRKMHSDHARKVAPTLRSGATHPDRSLIAKHSSRYLPAHLYAGLEAISRPVTYSKGSVLFVEGQEPAGAYMICKGQVKLSASSADGKSLIVGRADEGDVLGLPTSISGKVSELTAEAIKPVQCAFVARRAFLQFLRRHGQAALGVAEVLSDMYASTFDQLRNLGLSPTAEQKLARLLLDLSADDSQDLNNAKAKRLALTHKEMGEIIGASRETVTRLFTRFKRKHLVRVYDSYLYILDQDGLKQLLAF